MDGIEHETLTVNGVNIHIATAGPAGAPVVLFLHGFPDLWYSWRHQIPAVAAAGYRAIAPDLRGYGGSDSPPDASSYTCFHIVGDLIALIAAVAAGDEKVFVVGHDWGAIIGWYLCLFRPDKVRAFVALSVPFVSVNLKMMKPVEIFRAVYGDDFYVCRFQEPGDIEVEFAAVGTERVMKKILTYSKTAPLVISKDKPFWGSSESPVSLPSWLSEEDVRYYVDNFEKTGFTGAVNYYRNWNLNNELLAPWYGCNIQVPVKFITGDHDLVYHMFGIMEYIHSGMFKTEVPFLEEPVVLEETAHFLNQEKPEEVNQLICDFINRF